MLTRCPSSGNRSTIPQLSKKGFLVSGSRRCDPTPHAREKGVRRTHRPHNSVRELYQERNWNDMNDFTAQVL